MKKKIKVLCIEEGFHQYYPIVRGNTYEVDYEEGNNYYDINGVPWIKSRFLIKETLELHDVKNTSSIKSADISDWRNWTSKRPNECPCGGVRGVCPYH